MFTERESQSLGGLQMPGLMHAKRTLMLQNKCKTKIINKRMAATLKNMHD